MVRYSVSIHVGFGLTAMNRDPSAIMTYLVDKYDTTGKFSVTSVEDRAALQQWLFFQSSGQG